MIYNIGRYHKKVYPQQQYGKAFFDDVLGGFHWLINNYMNLPYIIKNTS